MCGVIQLTVDVIIVAQIFMYKDKNTPKVAKYDKIDVT